MNELEITIKTELEVTVEGKPFNEEIVKELLNLEDWKIDYKVHPDKIVITGAERK